ncbi:hypothetical protein B0J18DRAFT_226720 [Chaetomium sp. MPI-SDFR-AT-0129]|nr:hypothetical protein B0J18DRAFT_226720 [Chaetomium sp. MPI-SDFR-AT-0129]
MNSTPVPRQPADDDEESKSSTQSREDRMGSSNTDDGDKKDTNNHRRSRHEICIAQHLVLAPPTRALLVTVSGSIHPPKSPVSPQRGLMKDDNAQDGSNEGHNGEDGDDGISVDRDVGSVSGNTTGDSDPNQDRFDEVADFLMDMGGGGDISSSNWIRKGSGLSGVSKRVETPTISAVLESEAEKEDTKGNTTTKLPSRLGPFLLRSMSSTSSVNEGREKQEDSDPVPAALDTTEKKSLRTIQKEFYASRTTEWVQNLTTETDAVPGHVAPLAELESKQKNSEPEASSHKAMGVPHNPIQGNFIPLSKPQPKPKSRSSKERSSTDGPEEEPRSVYLKLSLTDSQMEKLTAVLSSEDDDVPGLPRGRMKLTDRNSGDKDRESDNYLTRSRSQSPAKMYQSNSSPARARSRSPIKSILTKTPESQRTIQGRGHHHQQNQASVHSTSSPNKARETPRSHRTTPPTYKTPTRSGGGGNSDSRGHAPAASKPSLAPIDTEIARAHARLAALRVGKQPAIAVHKPPVERAPSPVRQPAPQVYPTLDYDDTSSCYSQESPALDEGGGGLERHPSHISPLRIHKDYRDEHEPRHLSILQEYTERKHSARSQEALLEQQGQQQQKKENGGDDQLFLQPHHYQPPTYPPVVRQPVFEKQAQQSQSQPLQQQQQSQNQQLLNTPDDLSGSAEIAYTPLAPFLPRDMPTVRKVSKTLIGEGGWLENTSKTDPMGGAGGATGAGLNSSPTRGGGGFLGNLVKKAKEMMETNSDQRAQRKSRDSDKDTSKDKSSKDAKSKDKRPASRQLAISLSPREQSLLYCELEFALATALNEYLTAQFAAGRVSADRLKKVAEDWQRKGRPRVLGFRYDVETQLDMVKAHVHEFMFCARPFVGDPADGMGDTATGTTAGSNNNGTASTPAILAVLDTARSTARALRVRTFCQPDTVIAKQLIDARGLFHVLGCPEEQQIKMAEMIAFFRAAVERRRMVKAVEQQQAQQAQQQVQQAQQQAMQQGLQYQQQQGMPMHQQQQHAHHLPGHTASISASGSLGYSTGSHTGTYSHTNTGTNTGTHTGYTAPTTHSSHSHSNSNTKSPDGNPVRHQQHQQHQQKRSADGGWWGHTHTHGPARTHAHSDGYGHGHGHGHNHNTAPAGHGGHGHGHGLGGGPRGNSGGAGVGRMDPAGYESVEE